MNLIKRYSRTAVLYCAAGFALFLCCSMSAEKTDDFFTLIVLPDTQNYTDSSYGGKPDYFYEQTRWIRENKDELNIVMVAHAGDIIQSSGMSRPEWEIADKAFKTIDDAVPYILCPGNHDIRITAKTNTAENDARLTRLNDYFPPSRFTENPLYDANFGPDKNRHFREEGSSENYYLFFEGGGMKFLIIALEFKPRDEVLRWADEVAAEYPDRRCIIITHGYLDASGNRISMDNYKLTGNSGEEMWNKVISRYENIFLVLCGHVLGEATLSSTGTSGNIVHQVLADYQNDYIGNGGYGYLRIMKFFPDEDRIDVETYSPVLNEYVTSPKSSFSLDYHMTGKMAKTGS